MNNQTLIYKSIAQQPKAAVKEIVDKIIKSGKMSRQDHTLLTSTVLANGNSNEAERRLINQIFDYIQTGRLKLIDW